MKKLYPLKFKPIFKEKIWGGNKIHTILGKDVLPNIKYGESWEISGVKGDISIVDGGELNGMSLDDILNSYKENLVGYFVYEIFKNEFPLLIKFLDANEDLSIQVHPDDEIAKAFPNSHGKTEMWYVVQADENSNINVGFNKDITQDEFLYHLNNNSIEQLLTIEKVKDGDVYYVPGRQVHYIGKGCFITEIQQTSDTTFRIYDFDRVDLKGEKRELHTQNAINCLDLKESKNNKINYSLSGNNNKLIQSKYFSTNILIHKENIIIDYTNKKSFVILICIEGSFSMVFNDMTFYVKKGDTFLIPFVVKIFELQPIEPIKILEVYIE